MWTIKPSALMCVSIIGRREEKEQLFLVYRHCQKKSIESFQIFRIDHNILISLQVNNSVGARGLVSDSNNNIILIFSLTSVKHYTPTGSILML